MIASTNGKCSEITLTKLSRSYLVFNRFYRWHENFWKVFLHHLCQQGNFNQRGFINYTLKPIEIFEDIS